MLSTNPSMRRSTPRMIYTGIKKGIRGSIPFESSPVTQHVPQFFFLAEKGDDVPRLTQSQYFTALYGDETLNPNSDFFHHPSLGLRVALNRGQTILAERIIPPNAKKPMIRCSIELIPAEMPDYERNDDGSFDYDVDGNPISNGTAIKHNVIVHFDRDMYAGNELQFGRAGGSKTYRSGSLVSSLDTNVSLGEVNGLPQQSMIYPLFDVEHAEFGKGGDSTAMFIQALTSTTSPQIDLTTMRATRVFPFLVTLKQLPKNSAIPDIIQTVTGEDSMQMYLKDNISDPITGNQIGFADTFIRKYGDPSGVRRSKGPFGRVHVYSQNLTEILDKLVNGATYGSVVVEGEASYSAEYLAVGGDVDYSNPANLHRLNFLTGLDENDIPMYSFTTQYSAHFGGMNVEDGALVYATGGNDGLIYDATGKADRWANLKLLDELTRNRLNAFGVQSQPNMLNIVRYPVTALYDTGYSKLTKEAMMAVTSRRKDVYVMTSLSRVAEYITVTNSGTGSSTEEWTPMPRQTTAQLQSFAAYLYSRAQMIPESTVDGTDASRIMIVKGEGESFDPSYPLRTSFIFDVIDKSSAYFGSTSGNWDPASNYAERDNKNLLLIGSIDEENDISEPVADNLWENGCIYPLFRTPDTLYWPFLRGVHRDPTSPLVALEFIVACCTAVKEANSVFADLVSLDLPPNVFVERSNEALSQRLDPKTRFAGSFEIRVTTEITSADAQRTYSWTTTIEIIAQGYRTVNRLQIVGSSADFQNAA